MQYDNYHHLNEVQSSFSDFIRYVLDGDEKSALESLKEEHLAFKSEEGDTLLHFSASRNMAGLTRELLTRGMDPMEMNNRKVTPYDRAVRLDHQDIIKSMLCYRQQNNSDAIITEGQEPLTHVHSDEKHSSSKEEDNVPKIHAVYANRTTDKAKAPAARTDLLSGLQRRIFTVKRYKTEQERTSELERLAQSILRKPPGTLIAGEISSLCNLLAKLTPKQRRQEPIPGLLQRIADETVAAAATFTAKDIALVCNLLAKCNINDARWDASLTALAAQTVACAGDFKPQDIALVYNLIAHRADVNDARWDACLTALAAQTVACAGDFKPQDIALVYNHIAHRADVNDARWDASLTALAAQAVACAGDFKPQEIALVYNLIAQRADRHEERWAPCLTALAAQTVEFAGDFKPQDIALVYNLITRRADRHEERWAPCLTALAAQTVTCGATFTAQNITYLCDLFESLGYPTQAPWDKFAHFLCNYGKKQWESFQHNCITSKYEGPMRELFMAVRRSSIRHDELGTLGNTAVEHQSYYFNPSALCKDYAVAFLEAFWKKQQRKDAVLEDQRLKVQAQPTSAPLFPKCVSFVAVDVDERPFCLVALSGEAEGPARTALREFTASYTYGKDNKVKFLFAYSDLTEFNNLIAALTADSSAKNTCAEKEYTKTLAKLFLVYGARVRVTGSVSCPFYPYRAGDHYGLAADSIDRYVVPRVHHWSDRVLNNKHIISFMPCCEQCMHNKPALLSILKCAQEWYRDTSISSSSLSRPLSPLKNSLRLGTDNDKLTG